MGPRTSQTPPGLSVYSQRSSERPCLSTPHTPVNAPWFLRAPILCLVPGTGESGKAGVGELLRRWRNAGRVTDAPWPPPRPPPPAPVSCFSRSRAGPPASIVVSYCFHASPPTLSGWLYFYIYHVLICCISVPRETPKPVSTWTVLLTVLAPAASSGPRTRWTPRKQMGGWRGLPRLRGAQ